MVQKQTSWYACLGSCTLGRVISKLNATTVGMGPKSIKKERLLMQVEAGNRTEIGNFAQDLESQSYRPFKSRRNHRRSF